MATENDLVLQVMQELGVLGAGQNPTADDSVDIKLRYNQRLEMLLDENYADWDSDNIPGAAMPGLCKVIAYQVANLYHVERSVLVNEKGENWDDLGLAMLRRYMRKKPSYEPVRADYF